MAERKVSKVKERVRHRTTAPKGVELETLTQDEVALADSAAEKSADHIPAIVQQRYDERVAPFLFQVVLMTQAGETLAAVAKFLGMSRQTLDIYRQKFPGLQKALDVGKMAAEELAEQSLMSLVTGYQYKETLTTTDKEGKLSVKEWSKKKHPDVNAIIFYMVNRCSDRWRKTVTGDSNTQQVTLALGASNAMTSVNVENIVRKMDAELFKGAGDMMRCSADTPVAIEDAEYAPDAVQDAEVAEPEDGGDGDDSGEGWEDGDS